MGHTSSPSEQLLLYCCAQRGMAQLPDLHVSDSSEAMLSGRKPPFRLLVRAVHAEGRRMSIRHAVSEGFVVSGLSFVSAQIAVCGPSCVVDSPGDYHARHHCWHVISRVAAQTGATIQRPRANLYVLRWRRGARGRPARWRSPMWTTMCRSWSTWARRR